LTLRGLYEVDYIPFDWDNALFMFYLLNIWTAAFVFPLVISYHDFFYFLFILLLLVGWFLLYTHCVLGTSYDFNDISITYL
jgi:hypothetical protein